MMPKPRSRSGNSPKRCFMRSSNSPDFAELRVCIAQPVGQSLGKAEADLGSHSRMQPDEFNEVGMEESDQFRAFSHDRGCGACGIAKKGHLAEEVARVQFGQQDGTVGLELHDDIHPARAN